MRICGLCHSRDTVKQFALVMQPLDDKPVTPFERDLCADCAERVHATIKECLTTRVAEPQAKRVRKPKYGGAT